MADKWEIPEASQGDFNLAVYAVVNQGVKWLRAALRKDPLEIRRVFRENLIERDRHLSPDSQEGVEAGMLYEQESDRAGKVWTRLTPEEREKVLAAVEFPYKGPLSEVKENLDWYLE